MYLPLDLRSASQTNSSCRFATCWALPAALRPVTGSPLGRSIEPLPTRAGLLAAIGERHRAPVEAIRAAPPARRREACPAAAVRIRPTVGHAQPASPPAPIDHRNA